MPGPAIVEDAPVGGGGGVVRLVNDDGLEIRHEAGEPTAAAQGLHTGYHGGGGMFVARRLHDPEAQGGVDEVQFGYGLLDELIPVRQDEGPALPSLDEEGKHNRFARSRGPYEQGTLAPAGRGREQGRDRLILVWPGREPEGGGR